jgi:hypothetical protein
MGIHLCIQTYRRPGNGIECHVIFSGNGGDNTRNVKEPIKIIGYADDCIIHTTHKHERVSVVKLQKAMDQIVKWADDTGFRISIEKTKAMFSRKNTVIASRPRLDIWIKRTKIEQVRKHKILGTRMILE